MRLSEEIPPSEANTLLDAETGGEENPVGSWTPSHEDFGQEDKVPWSKCHKTWGALLLDFSNESLSSHNGLQPFNGYPVCHLMHGASTLVPIAANPVMNIMPACTNLFVPPYNKRNKEDFI